MTNTSRNNATLTPVDFRKPRGPSPTSSAGLMVWLNDACTLIGEAWSRQMSESAVLQVVRTESLVARQAVKELDDPGFGVTLSVGVPAVDVMLAMSLPLAVSMVSDLLGEVTKTNGTGETGVDQTADANADTSADTDQEAVADIVPQSLTDLEVSMLEMLFDQLARGLGDAWPGDDRLPSHAGQTVPRPARSRLFPMDEVLLVVHVRLQTRSTNAQMRWLFAQSAMADLIAHDWSPITPQLGEDDPRLPQLVESVPFEFVVQLGQASLTMFELTDLHRGDVLLLDQRISEPLQATVGDRESVTGWPGRIGRRQVFHIESLMIPEPD